MPNHSASIWSLVNTFPPASATKQTAGADSSVYLANCDTSKLLFWQWEGDFIINQFYQFYYHIIVVSSCNKSTNWAHYQLRPSFGSEFSVTWHMQAVQEEECEYKYTCELNKEWTPFNSNLHMQGIKVKIQIFPANFVFFCRWSSTILFLKVIRILTRLRTQWCCWRWWKRRSCERIRSRRWDNYFLYYLLGLLCM